MTPSILAIDAGNTRIKWGLHDGKEWLRRDAVATAEPHLVAAALRNRPDALVAIASNVAGPRVEERLREIFAEAGVSLRLARSEATQLGVENGYRDPRQLGVDRWVAMVAAHALQKGHKLVVNAGTALTVDALSAEGRFLGGLIVPGPALMRRSLDRGTAQLRLTEGTFQELPTSTPDAITSGAVQAGIGAIERMAAVMAGRGLHGAHVVLSGGAAAELAPHLSLPHAIHENLVLDGLVLIARTS